jgi:arsenite/tail-anchored protein-transporting ATPase
LELLPDFLTNGESKLFVFGGKGGVGKTTCAASAALSFSQTLQTEKILLVSTDPAHSLSDSLAEMPLPSNLTIIEFDAAQYLEEFRKEHGARLLEIADRGTFLDKEDISRFLNLSMPGMDELFGFLEISKWIEESKFDRIVVDTAPTGHTLRLLSMPRFFKSWIQTLDLLLEKHRYMKTVFSGFYSPDELDEFILSLSGSVENMEKILQDPSLSRFVPIMIAEELGVRETARLLHNLDDLGISAKDILVNRIYPEDAGPACSGRSEQLELLDRLPSEFADRTLWLLPLFPGEIRKEKLRELWNGISRFSAGGYKPEKDLRPFEVRHIPVKNPAPTPSADSQLILFAGKGGVGKTTLACATAVRLARQYRDKKILIFSSDPAHSLSDCLATEAAPEPKRIMPGLFAMEIDSEARFESLKQAYRQELDEFLNSILRNVDLAFDREVMEHIMDLSPPGLDEIIALTDMLDSLESEKFDILILDTAPTGHLIRLLELPELLDQWIKAFFELFLKYRNLFHLPRVSERLVSLSKSLKRFRSLLRDSRQASLSAVTIPTEMAREETADLVAACRRTGIAVPNLFINQATGSNGCDFCSRLQQSESEVIDRITSEFSSQFQTIIFRRTAPRGLKLLEELGKSVYGE